MYLLTNFHLFYMHIFWEFTLSLVLRIKQVLNTKVRLIQKEKTIGDNHYTLGCVLDISNFLQLSENYL